jgi:DNA-binding NtrC family response regulator
MTRVLLVYQDIDVADVEGDELRRLGYEVDRCAGPVGGEPCPVLRGEPCWQVEKADVLVYDVWKFGRHGPDLVDDLRALHPDKPLVLTSSNPELGSIVVDEHQVPPIFHAPSRDSLPATIERALRAPVAPHPDPTPRHPVPAGVPRW